MATYKKFEDIEVWQRARTLANRIFEKTLEKSFAGDFKLRDQINGSSGSIMDNIAEGFERDGTREFIQFLSIAKGSAGETRSQLYRAQDRRHISHEDFEILHAEVSEISKQLSGLIRYLSKTGHRGLKYAQKQE